MRIAEITDVTSSGISLLLYMCMQTAADTDITVVNMDSNTFSVTQVSENYLMKSHRILQWQTAHYFDLSFTGAALQHFFCLVLQKSNMSEQTAGALFCCRVFPYSWEKELVRSGGSV